MIKFIFNIQILILLSTNFMFSQTSHDTLYIASWNLENLFDTVDDPNKRDEEFLPTGKKEWTDIRVDRKLENLAEVISKMNNCKGPSILGVTEVEHQHLLDSMIVRHFPDRNYKVAYAESPDNRGIDNGLIYNADIFTLKLFDTLRVDLASGYPTRYIFQADLINKRGMTLHFFVNHWPSRSGGEEKSRPNRIKAAETLRRRVETLFAANGNALICILGDLNDEPNNESIQNTLGTMFLKKDMDIENKSLYNLSSVSFENGEGTYLYRGEWNMLDQIILSSGFFTNERMQYIDDSFELFKPSFLLTKSGKYQGAATPTFGGSKYLGGYSDHIPVGAKFIEINVAR